MSELYEVVERPDFERPVLVLALDGWVDAGLAAATARATLLDQLDTTLVAAFDADELLDHRARRPVMHLEDGVISRLVWPAIELRAGRDPDGGELLLLVGAEPDHRWHAFVGAVGSLAAGFGARLVVGLGAYPAAVPHSRPSRLAVAASTPELVHRLQFVLASIEAPSGVHAAIEQYFAGVGVDAVGLWAQVPHYAATMPYPAAAAALLDGLAEAGGLALDRSELHREGETTRSQLDSLIARNPEHQTMVSQLESQWDSWQPEAGRDRIDPGSLPTGDELAAELERFLRDQG
jgi:predicted ATP-grasp superfamily ATP-dependent carboligase